MVCALIYRCFAIGLLVLCHCFISGGTLSRVYNFAMWCIMAVWLPRVVFTSVFAWFSNCGTIDLQMHWHCFYHCFTIDLSIAIHLLCNCFTIAWPLFGHCIIIAYRLLYNCLLMDWPLQFIVCQLLVHCLAVDLPLLCYCCTIALPLLYN